MKKNIVWKEGRDANNGQFTSVEKAKRYKTTHVVETLKRKR